MVNDLQPLIVPLEESLRYDTNFIKTAVCELRFPTLLELEERPPIKFQNALKKLYPFFSKAQAVPVNPGRVLIPEARYLFESKKRDWTIALKPSTLSLETTSYIDFGDFSERFNEVLDEVGGFLDTDFLTRIGLRYINGIPLPKDIDFSDIDKWINPVLVSALKGGAFGSLRAFHCEVGGYISLEGLDDGGYTFRHGLGSGGDQENESILYMLDYDYFIEGVEFNKVQDVITQFNAQNFSFLSGHLVKRH